MTQTGGTVEVRPTLLDFGKVWLGSPDPELTLVIHNRSRGSRTITLTTGAPFTAAERLELAGAESRDVPVRFAPREEGNFTARLTFRGDANDTVELRGTAQAPPECMTSSACQISYFDFERGECTTSVSPDDTACETECVREGTCSNGTCVGNVSPCDDGNACTQDVCSPELGCFGFDDRASCAHDENPCLVAACDPAEGCIQVPVQDGTRCGPSDCSMARVCIVGQCVTRAVPQGSVCGEGSPCQESGRCRDGVCVRAPAAPLEPLWAAPLVPASRKTAIDAEGTVYALDVDPQDPASMRLRAWTREGFPRYERDLGIRAVQWLLTGRRWIGADESGTVEARELVDGQLAWSRTYGPELSAGEDVWKLDGIAAMDSGDVVLVVHQLDGPVFVLRIEGSSGDVSWIQQVTTHAFGSTPLLDEQGNAFVGLQRGAASFLASGAKRWSGHDSNQFLAAFGGVILGTDGAVRASDGRRVYGPPVDLSGEPYPLMTSGASYLSTRHSVPVLQCAGEPELLLPSSQLVSWATATGELLWSRHLPEVPHHRVSNLMLTSDLSALFVHPTPDCSIPRQFVRPPMLLREIEATGTERFSCALGSADDADGFALDRGRLFGLVHDSGQWRMAAYDLGTRDVARAGWSMRGGSLEGDNRPR